MKDIIAFIIISMLSGTLAIFFYISIYRMLAKSPITWLLLAVTSIFMISTPLLPSAMIIKGKIDQKLLLLMLTYWGAVYTSFFAAAGFTLYRACVHFPKKSLGKFVLGEIEKSTPSPIKDEQLKKLSKLVMILYNEEERYEDAVIKMCLLHVAVGYNVVLCSKNSIYEEYIGDKVRIVRDLSNIQLSEDIVAVLDVGPSKRLIHFIECFDGIRLLVFLKERYSAYENMFTTLLEVNGDYILGIKGEKIKIHLENFVDYEKHSLRGKL